MSWALLSPPPRQPFLLGFCVHTQHRLVLESLSVVCDPMGDPEPALEDEAPYYLLL